jgi:hypothetical protein
LTEAGSTVGKCNALLHVLNGPKGRPLVIDKPDTSIIGNDANLAIAPLDPVAAPRRQELLSLQPR